jgi:hypothetical protein
VQPGAATAPGIDGLARRLLDAGHVVWTLPPAREDGLLLRVLGPAVAQLAALRIVEYVTGTQLLDLSSIPTAARRAQASGPDLFGDARRPIAIVAAPALAELAMPLRWKLLEGLRVPDPSVWDPLQVAHGPLQSIYDERMTLLCLRCRDDGADDLFARLRAVLSNERHTLVELRAASAAPAAIVELDAFLDAALVATLTRHPLALDDWPTKGRDGPLYDVDPVLLRGR